jgi:hypothetical protein
VITLCTDFQPILLQDIGPSPRSEDDWRRLFSRMHEISEGTRRRRGRHVTVAFGEDPSVSERKIVARLLNEAPPEDALTSVGSVVIAPSAVTRGILTALRWLSPQFTNVYVVATGDESIEMAAQLLAKQGVAVDSQTKLGARDWLRARTARR